MIAGDETHVSRIPNTCCLQHFNQHKFLIYITEVWAPTLSCKSLLTTILSEYCCLLGCDTMWFSGSVPEFQRTVLHTSSHWSLRRGQHIARWIAITVLEKYTAPPILFTHEGCGSTEMVRVYKLYHFQVYQQDAALYNILYHCQCCTCFRRFLRPSSGAQKLYTQHLV